MGLLDYHRTIIAYHGCDAEILQKVLAGNENLTESRRDYDWLGRGVYFWEHGPQWAIDWAKDRCAKAPHGNIKNPATIGAFVNLGQCFDLLDTRYTKILEEMFPMFKKTFEEQGILLPENKSPQKATSTDHVMRFLDCAMINWCLDRLEKRGQVFQTVRCVFSEGEPAFKNSKIMAKSHIQIAVRDPSCILGFFKPNIDRVADRMLIAQEANETKETKEER